MDASIGVEIQAWRETGVVGERQRHRAGSGEREPGFWRDVCRAEAVLYSDEGGASASTKSCVALNSSLFLRRQAYSVSLILLGHFFTCRVKDLLVCRVIFIGQTDRGALLLAPWESFPKAKLVCTGFIVPLLGKNYTFWDFSWALLNWGLRFALGRIWNRRWPCVPSLSTMICTV
jgi:hypothetical protein